MTIKFEHDDDIPEIMEKVNKVMKRIGVELVADGDENEDCVYYELKVNRTNILNQVRELVRKAPLGYYDGRLVKHGGAKEKDVVDWLVSLHETLGL
jgi:hypothetical protein